MRSGLVLVAAVAAAGLARAADEKPHPLVAQVKKQLKDPTKPFTLIVMLQPKEGEEAKLEEAFGPAIKATRKEKGCLRYELNRATGKGARYLLYERWQSVADLEAHLKSAHIKKLLADLKDALAKEPSSTVLLPAGD